MRQELSISSIAYDLISSTGLIDSEVLVRAHLTATKNNIPFGRALVMAGHLGEGDLTSLLQASQLVKQGHITVQIAVPILVRALAECQPFPNLLHEIKNIPRRKLADLLLNAQLLSEGQLNSFISQSAQKKLTLGRLLVLTKTVTNEQLESAIDILVLIRSKCITEELAARAFRIVWFENATIPEALAKCGVYLHTAMPKLGQLLAEAGVLSKTEVLNSAEIGIEVNKPIGEILFQRQLVPSVVLTAALHLQGLVLSGKLNFAQAQELLKQAHLHQFSVERMLEELGELKKNIVAFLKISRTVTEKDLREAVELYPVYKDDCARALLASEAINLKAFKTAVHCLNLVQNDTMNMNQAILIFRSCQRTGISINEAVSELTLNINSNVEALDNRIAGAA